MAKRRLPKDAKREYAERAIEYGMTRKTVDELLHRWVSKEKRRTHKRERREGRRAARDTD